jgi:POT family proton-dependent oligopeptide transporter
VTETVHPADVPRRTVFGHPIGLTNLFGVELWERFSFYGMVLILGYYLYYSLEQGGLGLPQATATGIVGAYGGVGTSMSGVLAQFYSADREFAYFGVNGLVVIVVGLVLLALSPWIVRHMEGVH